MRVVHVRSGTVHFEYVHVHLVILSLQVISSAVRFYSMTMQTANVLYNISTDMRTPNICTYICSSQVYNDKIVRSVYEH